MNNLQKTLQILNKKEKIICIGLVIMSGLQSVLEIFSIGILVPIINLFLNPEMIDESPKLHTLYRWSGASDAIQFLVALVIIAIILFVGKSCWGVLMYYWQQKYTADINRRLSGDTLEDYLHRPYEFHLLNNSSVLFKNINVEVSLFVSHLLSPIIVIISESIVLCGVLFVVVFLYPGATIAALIVIGVVVVGLNQVLKRKIARYAEIRSSFSEQYYQAIMESLQSVKEIKIFNGYDYFVKKYLNSFGHYINSVVKSNALGSIPRYLFESLIFSSVLGVILVGVYSEIDYKQIIPVLAIFGAVSIRLLPSINKILQSINSMHFSSNSLDIVYGIVSSAEENTLQGNIKSNSNMYHESLPIHFSNVSFGYASGQHEILNEFNLTINPNTITALVGETGSGKSTVIDIIMGILLPQKGDVYYGNEQIDKGTVEIYRKKIGYVPQTITLIDETIAANIAFGVHVSSREDELLKLAVERAQLASFIDELPDGLQTVVGERGVRLSGGQRQRIGIARALYRDPEILIFDEATSALDVHTEELIYQSIKELKKTIIIVTHRPTTLAFADMIYVIDKGSIRDHGSYARLCERSEYFTKLTSTNHD